MAEERGRVPLVERDPIEALPRELQQAARQIAELAIKEGHDISLGQGVVVSSEIDHRCTCTCAVVARVDGPGQISKGGHAEYTATAKIAESGSECKDCKAGSFSWDLLGAPNGVTKRQTVQGSDKVTVDVADSVPKGTKFKLQVTPSATCQCPKAGGGADAVNCTPTAGKTNDIVVV